MLYSNHKKIERLLQEKTKIRTPDLINLRMTPVFGKGKVKNSGKTYSFYTYPFYSS